MTVLAVVTSWSNVKMAVIPGGVAVAAISMNQDSGGTGLSNDFDNTFARGVFLASLGSSEPILDLRDDYDDFWIHFENNNSGTISGNGNVGLSFYSEAGELQYAWVGTSTGGQYHLYKSTNNSTFNVRLGTDQFVLGSTDRITIDVHTKNDATDGVFDVFVNGSLVASYHGDTTTNGANAVRYVRFRTQSGNNDWEISQVIAADQSTIGWKVQDLAPLTGTQAFSQWTGTFSDCDDFAVSPSKADSIYANVDGHTESFVVNDVVSGAASMFVVAVAVSARTVTAPGSAVETFTPGLSVGGTFYEGGDFTSAPEDGEQVVQSIWHTNPATASGWTQSDVNSMQIGVRAKT